MSRAERLHTPAFLGAAALLALAWLVTGGGAAGAPVVLTLGALVLVLGLPHGALDLWIAARQRRWGREGRFTPGGALRFHAEYLALAALTVAAFWAAPVVALAGFLALSLWHFADDWRALPAPLRLGCASVTVLAPTLFRPEEVGAIFEAMTGADGLTVLVPLARPFIGGVLGAVIAAALVADRRAGAEVVGLVVLALALPPLAFFAAYFVMLHAPRHVLRQHGAARGRRGRLLLAAYTLAALLLVAGAGAWLARGEGLALTEVALRAVFVGLAALTVPHALLIEADRRAAGGVGRRAGPA